MVRVVETGDPLGVTLAGEKVQLEAAGNPLQANVTVETTPFIGITEMVNVAVWPALMVAVEGEADSSKSPAPFPTMKVWDTVLGKISASPTYSAEMVWVPWTGGRKETDCVAGADAMNAPLIR